MDVKLIAKLLAHHLRRFSGGLLERRVAFRPAREATFGPTRGATAGFRRLSRRAQFR
jgi:hypothetical protein